MSSLKDVFRVLEQMRDGGIVTDYAIGGATAVLFYAEPTRTYDVDVFITLPRGPMPGLVSLSSVYEWATSRGIEIQGEHLMIESVPVQLLPAYNALVEEGVVEARAHDYEGVPMRVVDPEHLVAYERFSTDMPYQPKFLTMSEPTAFDATAIFERNRAWHHEQTRLPLREKVRILLELQRQELPLLARQRTLRPWERPWQITP